MEYTVKRIENTDSDIATELVIFYLLEGTMTFEYYGKKYAMNPDDIILISPGIPYFISSCKEALCGVVKYEMSVVSAMTGSRNIILHCNSVVESDKSYKELRWILNKLTREFVKGEHPHKAYTDSLLLALLNNLAEGFEADYVEPDAGGSDSDARMNEMMQYVIANLDREISLSELADKMFVSPSTLSRIFKKSTGEYFADYVLELRVNNAKNQLKYTDRSITEVALSTGFGNSSSFNRAFKKHAGCTPMEYRKNHQPEDGTKKKESYLDIEIKRELIEKGFDKDDNVKREEVFIDLNAKTRAYDKCWQEIINIGAISLLSSANMQYHTLFLSEQLHFKYFRVWSIFDKKLMITDGKTIGQYNYDLVDQIFDFLVEHGITPFLDFGRRPATAFKSEGDAVYIVENAIEFDSKKIWEHLLKDFIDHIVLRYGMDEVSGWKFELSRNAIHDRDVADNRIYTDDNYDFFDAFKSFYRIIKGRLKEACVGGFSGSAANEEDYFADFLKRCIEDGLDLDFVSFILFPYVPADGENAGSISGDTYYESRMVDRMKSVIESLDFRVIPKLYITEWNNTISNRNFLNDSPFRSAYIVKKVIGFVGNVDAVGLMAGSDWISSYMDSLGIISGSVGLITKDTIRKPAFYSLEFLNQLGDSLIESGENYFAVRKESGGIYIITCNPTWVRNNYLAQKENLDIQDINRVFDDDKNLCISFEIGGLSPGRTYCIKRRILNSHHGSVLDEWEKFQYDRRLTRADIKYIDGISIPNLSQQKVRLEKTKDTLHLDVSMEINEVDLIHIFMTED